MNQNYLWAANKSKLLRSIAFVNSGLGVQVISDEKREQMVKEYYVQIAGLMNPEVVDKPRVGRPKKEVIEPKNETI